VKRLNKPAGSSDNTESTSVDGRTISEMIGQIDDATKKVFHSYAIELLNEPITNVAEAVWGASTDKSRFTPAQKQIDHTLSPVIRNIENTLEEAETVGTKHRVIDCLIKKLAISQLVFMVEYLKLSLIAAIDQETLTGSSLADTEVAGHA